MAISAEARMSDILQMLNSPTMLPNITEKDGITTWTIKRKNKLNTVITYNSHLKEWTISVPNGPFLSYFDILKLKGPTMMFLDGIPIKNLSYEEYCAKREDFTITINYSNGNIEFHGNDLTKFIVYAYLFPKK